MIVPSTFKLTNKVIHRVAKPFTFEFPERNLAFGRRMLEFMTAQQGIGLAAPQIGISKRLFVMRIGNLPYICFNPEITEFSEELYTYEEGCLSYPNEFLNITRPKQIKGRYQNHRGDWTGFEFNGGLISVCFQHELDHLDGIVMHDRLRNDNSSTV